MSQFRLKYIHTYIHTYIIHTYMEMSQENSLLYSYLKQTKMPFFFSFFFFLQNQRTRGLDRSCLGGRVVPVGGAKMWGKGVGG
jgi:hypothetical protein